MPANRHRPAKAQPGFTLIEVLMVAALCAIVAGIVIIAISPSREISEARNSQRTSDLATIADALARYRHDKGALPDTVPVADTELCATSVASCAGLVDLQVLTKGGKYLQAVPTDPQCATLCIPSGTGYKVHKDGAGQVVLSAPFAEGKVVTATK
jgi:prepilin-type N-terminal cleavage/methylation domain-containing protein